MSDKAPLRWFQFRVRSLLAVVLIVRLGCIASLEVMRVCREYQRARIMKDIAQIEAALATYETCVPVPGEVSDSPLAAVHDDRKREMVAQLRAHFANLRAIAPNSADSHPSGSTFQYVEGPISPVQMIKVSDDE